MAPTAPTPPKRKSLRLKATERLANPHLPRKVHRPDSAVTDAFLSTKADKRLIKHASFVSRITKPSTSRARDKNAKRHARNRQAAAVAAPKTLATLDALADALPSLTPAEVRAGEAEREGRVRHRSLGSKRGALKKRERVVRHEMERFSRSLAQLQAVEETAPSPTPALASLAAAQQQQQQQQQQATGGDATMGEGGGVAVEKDHAPSTAANRFAALRGFIAATMEQNPAFRAQKETGA